MVGGQPGAGKSRLIGTANSELGNNAVIVDFDELRRLHPSYLDVSNNYPEITYKILQKDLDVIKDMLVEYLTENEYNVIYEGALRNVNGFLKRYISYALYAFSFSKNTSIPASKRLL